MKKTEEMIREGNLWGGLFVGQEYEKAHVADTEDLLAMGQRLRRKKGFGGTEQ